MLRIFALSEATQPEFQVERPVGVGMAHVAQLADACDRQSRFFTALADGTRRSFFARQAPSARELRPAGERLIEAARADEIATLMLDDGNRHALARLVGRIHSLPCISAGGAPIMW